MVFWHWCSTSSHSSEREETRIRSMPASLPACVTILIPTHLSEYTKHLTGLCDPRCPLLSFLTPFTGMELAVIRTKPWERDDTFKPKLHSPYPMSDTKGMYFWQMHSQSHTKAQLPCSPSPLSSKKGCQVVWREGTFPGWYKPGCWNQFHLPLPLAYCYHLKCLVS